MGGVLCCKRGYGSETPLPPQIPNNVVVQPVYTPPRRLPPAKESALNLLLTDASGTVYDANKDLLILIVCLIAFNIAIFVACLIWRRKARSKGNYQGVRGYDSEQAEQQELNK